MLSEMCDMCGWYVGTRFVYMRGERGLCSVYALCVHAVCVQCDDLNVHKSMYTRLSVCALRCVYIECVYTAMCLHSYTVNVWMFHMLSRKCVC